MGDIVQKPLVSVVIPVYKVEKYLHQCVDSVLNQTYPHLEIILVDDGSPDSCPGICDEYAQQDSRVRVIHKENGGLSDARNAGMAVCTGEYLMFVDSDDWIAPDFIASFLDEIQNADMVLSGLTMTSECGKIEREVMPISDNLYELAENSLLGYACNKMYKKLRLTDYQFQKIIREDLLFNLNYLSAEANCSLRITKNTGYFYRQHKNSVLHSFKKIEQEELSVFINAIGRALKNLNSSDDQKAKIYNKVVYTMLTDSFARLRLGTNTFASDVKYVAAVLSTVPNGMLQKRFASNRLFLMTYLAKRYKLYLPYALLLKIAYRK